MQSYKELTVADIRSLVHILAESPSASTAQTHDNIDKQTRELPSYLRCKIPWLTSMCSAHKRLNATLISSIRAALLTTAERELATCWKSAQLQGQLQPETHQMIAVLTAYIERSQQTMCAGCELSRMGNDLDLLVSLGSIILAKLRPKDWRRSRRMIWIESCVEQCCQQRPSDILQQMWQTGSQLRRLRQQIRNEGDDRAYIDHYVEEATRPLRSPAGDVHSAPIKSPDTLSTAIIESVEKKPNGPESYSSRNRVPGSAKPSVFANAFQDVDMDNLFPAASSVYSRGASHTTLPMRAPLETRWAESNFEDAADDILDLYRQSLRPLRELQEAESLSGETDGQPLARRAKDPALAYFPRHKLAPITIPKNSSGKDPFANPPRSSGLWRRRAESRLLAKCDGKPEDAAGLRHSTSAAAKWNENVTGRDGNWI